MLTEGRITPTLVRFSIPLILTAFLQQLYNVVDTAIVGRCISVDALSAVGLTGSLTFLVLGVIIGCAVGFCIQLAQSFGAGDESAFGAYLWNGLYLTVALGLVVTVLTVPLRHVLLRLLNTPEELYQMAEAYLLIILSGSVVTAFYNYVAGILRATGDSKHPLVFLLISSVLNLMLDLLFILVFHMGVRGAALATVLSQIFSGALCLDRAVRKARLVKRRAGGVSVTGLHVAKCKTLLASGLPMGLNYSITAIGNVVLQGSINRLGTVAVAAQTTGEKIRQMLTMPVENIGAAANTFVAQNYGAGRLDRVKGGLKSALIVSIVYDALAFVLLFFGKRAAVSAVLGADTGAEAEGAVYYLGVISTLFVFHAVLIIFRNFLQGLGFAFIAMMSAAGEILGRVLGGLLAVRLDSFLLICLANPFAWIIAGAFLVFVTPRLYRRISGR